MPPSESYALYRGVRPPDLSSQTTETAHARHSVPCRCRYWLRPVDPVYGYYGVLELEESRLNTSKAERASLIG